MTMAVTIRDMQPADSEAARALIGKLQDYEASLHARRLRWEIIADAYWAELLSDVYTNDGFIYVAERNGKLIGVAAGWPDQKKNLAADPSFWRFGYVQDLYVEEECRRQGVGRALMDVAERFFAGKGLDLIRLAVLAKNVTAMTFYEHAGMDRYLMHFTKRISPPISPGLA
jgi:ribosomal protein S18 acetylase RimI-like enzyme